jgi:hypothetical protein
MNNFLLFLLVVLLGFCALSLYLLVTQVATIIGIIEEWVTNDDEDEDDDNFFSFTPDPTPHDDDAMRLDTLRANLTKQFQKS